VPLAVDEGFAAAREYYREFSAVSDEQVMAMLEQARRRMDPALSGPPGLLVSLKNPRAGHGADHPCPPHSTHDPRPPTPTPPCSPQNACSQQAQ
jgi:hypothetical protein